MTCPSCGTCSQCGSRPPFYTQPFYPNPWPVWTVTGTYTTNTPEVQS